MGEEGDRSEHPEEVQEEPLRHSISNHHVIVMLQR